MIYLVPVLLLGIFGFGMAFLVFTFDKAVQDCFRIIEECKAIQRGENLDKGNE